ncbi:matrixin family metalloprotease, partial [Bradyrhizobium sp. 1]|uniref:matrixin family metalloprotease n=1 Tax=Bradyrhizobium sp. 1 TaxID=241591 RepID=UPI001FF8ADB7
MATSVTISATNNADIDGLLSGYKWTGAITYSFPDSSSDYANPYSGGSGEPTTSGFASAPTQMQSAINYAIGLILGYTNASIQYAGTNGADIMIAQSPAANPTSYAYYPGNYAPGGDVWFGTRYDYTQAKLGNYFFTTALHELGHALGLKHSQETGGPANVAVPSAHDDSEYTVMSYRSYVGASTTAGYTNETYGYSQTYMANDILALQTLYGANYTTQSGNTIYTWSTTTGQEFINGVGQLAPGGGAGGSANRIYETVWDGNGVDTYDLSNYTTNLNINLNPGASSVFSTVQLANLGDGHYASGNVYNAYLYNGDARSYIDNAAGGSGNDTILGNAIANVLNGGSGNDTITGGGGNDTIIGGAGTDTAVYSGSRSNYGITYNSSTQTFTFVDLRSGSSDGTDTITGVENFQFADTTLSSTTLIAQVGNLTVEAIGTTSLVQLNGYYYLNPTAGGTGPTLKDSSGSAISVGTLSALVPLGAEQVGSGYYVAWKSVTYDQYVVWNVDSSGTRSAFDVASYVSGTSYALESLETSFHQDLNGDGTIGVVTTVIESAGATSLTQVANNYYFYQSGVGPELKRDIVPVVAGQFAPFVPIGVEKTSTGYDLAWKVPGADQYIVWNVDNSGNFIANLTSIESGNSSTMESYETIFHQDLNGDGSIGVPAASATNVIESAGSTSLTQMGSNYFFYESGAGPELMRGGAAVVAGQFAPFVPIGVEKTSTGYDLAWKASGADQYIIWSV